MKRILGLIISVMAVSVIGWAGIAHAGNVRTGTNSEVAVGETIDGTLYMAGDTVKVAGTIKGDLFCAGQRVEITGTIEGDVICAGQVLVLKGKVLGDARVAALTATLDGNVDGSLTMAAQLATLATESRVGRDITMVAGDATLSGRAGRDVRAVAEVFTFDGTADRHVHVRDVEDAKLGETAVIAGEFIYTSNNQAQIADGAKVGLKTERLIPEEPAEQPDTSLAGYITGMAFMFSGMILVALAILVVAPKLLETTAATLRRRHLWAFGIGLVIMVFAPIVALILLFTIVGGALSLLVLLAWIALLLSATTYTAYTIGQIMAEKMQWKTVLPYLTNLSLGFLALFVLALIPFVNILVLACAVTWGAGGVVIACIERLRVVRPMPPVAPQPKQK